MGATGNTRRRTGTPGFRQRVEPAVGTRGTGHLCGSHQAGGPRAPFSSHSALPPSTPQLVSVPSTLVPPQDHLHKLQGPAQNENVRSLVQKSFAKSLGWPEFRKQNLTWTFRVCWGPVPQGGSHPNTASPVPSSLLGPHSLPSFLPTVTPQAPPHADAETIDSHIAQAAEDPRGQPLHLEPRRPRGWTCRVDHGPQLSPLTHLAAHLSHPHSSGGSFCLSCPWLPKAVKGKEEGEQSSEQPQIISPSKYCNYFPLR